MVTPTLERSGEVAELLKNLAQQTILPFELILVDGAPHTEIRTEELVIQQTKNLPYVVHYIRHGGGTAIQRNVGIEKALGDFIAFVDDDIRLEADFFSRILEIFNKDHERKVGGVIGYITNQYLDLKKSRRWQWLRRLKLLTTYEPGRFDFNSGYPINRYLQPPFVGVKEVDFMSTNCAVWRRVVIDSGLRFDEFFTGYGVLEDAHFALRAGKHWKLLECGSACCIHLRSKSGRENPRQIMRKTAINHRYVFIDIVPQRTWVQEFRFWRVQLFDLVSLLIAASGSPQRAHWLMVVGKIEGILSAWNLKPT